MRRHGWISGWIPAVGSLLVFLAGCGGQAAREESAEPPPEPAGYTDASPVDGARREDFAAAEPGEPWPSSGSGGVADASSQGEPVPQMAPPPMPAAVEPVEPDPQPGLLAESFSAAEDPMTQPVEGPALFAPTIEAPPLPQATRSASVPRVKMAPSPYAMELDAAGSSNTERMLAQPRSLSVERNMAAAAPSEPESFSPEARMALAAPIPAAAPAGGSSPEMASPAESEPAPPAAEPATEDYTTITVFYGTDRLPLQGGASGGLWNSGWLTAAAVWGAITLVVTLIAIRLARRRAAIVLGAAGAMATVALATLSMETRPYVSSGQAGPQRVYGNQRGTLEMGTCQVSVPRVHEVGQVERPSIFRLEFQEDPTQHVVLADVVQQSEDEFYSRLQDRIGKSPKREAFVFVHGFNVTFEAAARRTAQLAYDLKVDAAPIFFSWPSQGGLLQYTVDETNVVWTVPHLKQFLLGIVQRSGAQSVHLIAHSMGNRALTSALQSIAYEFRDSPPMFNQVVLTAPDIDADVFRRDIAPAVIKTAGRVTLYASSNDEALLLSKQIHGYPRAGDTGDGLLVIPGIDTIDVSTVDTSLIGHSYYGSNSTVLEDLLDLLHEAKPPEQRPWLHPMQLGRMMYWVFLAERNRLESAASRLPATRQ